MSHIDFEEVTEVIENTTNYSYDVPEIPVYTIDLLLTIGAILFLFKFIQSLKV